MSRILIVEDTDQSRYLLEYALSGAGHEVSVAAHGSEALERARSASPELVVSDILMPVMDGFALCREWRADPALCDIPFMFYTATFTDPQDERLALSLGADRFVVKRSDPLELVPIIADLLAAPTVSGRPAGRVSGAHTVETLRNYNEALVRKLEKKVADLEALRRLLEREKVELERWQEATLGREGRVQELKREVNALCLELRRPPRYASEADGT